MGGLVSRATFQPPRAQSAPVTAAAATVHTSLGDHVPVLYVAPTRDDQDVLFACHGNADDLDSFARVALALAAHLDVGLYAFEYPGYAGTLGAAAPSERHTYAAALSAFDALTKTHGIARERIVVYGKSLGSAVATYVAEHRYGVKALVLVSPLLSAFRVAIPTLSVTLPGDIMATIDHIANVEQAAIIIIHGRADEVVPPRHAQWLFEAAVMSPLRIVTAARTFPVHWLSNALHNFEVTAAAAAAVGDDDDGDDDTGRRLNDAIFATFADIIALDLAQVSS